MADEKEPKKKRRRRRRKRGPKGSEAPKKQGQPSSKSGGDRSKSRRKGNKKRRTRESKDDGFFADIDVAASPIGVPTQASIPISAPVEAAAAPEEEDEDEDFDWPHREPPNQDADKPLVPTKPGGAAWNKVCEVAVVSVPPIGKTQVCLSSQRVKQGDTVVVRSGQHKWLGTVTHATVRKQLRHKPAHIIERVASPDEVASSTNSAESDKEKLAEIRALCRSRKLDMKVFRLGRSLDGETVEVHFTAEQRVDFRGILRDLASIVGARVEMRQTGVRDRAKMTGGIGSCGQELCCTTWLPDFVPVSIKMAKDQGLVLNPTKVSGQCGRLKCCLVYEQDTYAQMRKGLPKLGKRVIMNADEKEGRVVEVNVLKRKIRVSLGGGDSVVVGPDAFRPMFPSQRKSDGQSKGKNKRNPRPKDGDQDNSSAEK